MTAPTPTLRERVHRGIEAAETQWRSQDDGGLSLQVLLGLIENRMDALLADADGADHYHERCIEEHARAFEESLEQALDRAEQAEARLRAAEERYAALKGCADCEHVEAAMPRPETAGEQPGGHVCREDAELRAEIVRLQGLLIAAYGASATGEQG